MIDNDLFNSSRSPELMKNYAGNFLERTTVVTNLHLSAARRFCKLVSGAADVVAGATNCLSKNSAFQLINIAFVPFVTAIRSVSLECLGCLAGSIR